MKKITWMPVLARGAAQLATVERAASNEGTVRAGRMLAWRVHGYGSLNELRLEEARVPPLRAPDDMLVRVHAASINPLDVAMIGGYGACLLNILRGLEGTEGVEFPLTVGRDFVGTVERAGPAARHAVGTRVWGAVPPHKPGTHAHYVLVKDHWVTEAPRRLETAACGGAAYAALTACAALRVAGLQRAAGRRVLLLGLGGVGHAALQLLVQRNAQVVVGCAGEQCARALALGAVSALDRHAPEYEQMLCDYGPYEVILDCGGLGGDAATKYKWVYSRYVTLTTPLLREADARGAVLGAAAAATALLRQCVGAATAHTNTTNKPSSSVGGDDASGRVVSRGAAGSGSGSWSCPPPHVRWAYFMPSQEDLLMLRRLADNGQFSVDVERVYPWWEARDAMEHAARGHARGKLLLDFTAEKTK